MCGIVAYYGKSDQVLPLLIGGLKRLEYRGYDSSGIAIVESNHDIFCKKSVGKIVNLESQIDVSILPSFANIGIAHTRWATHGQPTTTNAHPHVSQDGNFYLVHNGIIENYKELKISLESNGIVFQSQTDTEVLINLIAKNYTSDLLEAVKQSLNQVQGTFAIAVISKLEPNRLIVAKFGAPLILGVLANEFLIASDVSAIISKTKEVIYLEDGEVVDIQNDDYEISNFIDSQKVVSKKTQTVEWSEEQANKEGYDHFLLKEIMEQPKSVLDSTRGRLIPDEANIQLGGLIDVQYRLKAINKVILLGVGTSFYSCKLGEMYFESIAGITAKAEMSPEFRYKNTLIDENTWIIAVSQSGETADTIAAIEEAKRRGALVTGIVNTVGSTISRITKAGVYNHIGPEISVASTKAFTSQSLILLMHSIFLGRIRQLSFSKAKELIDEIQILDTKIKQVLDQNANIQKLAEKYYQYNNMIYTGRQYNYPIAMEGALKIKEISYIHAEGLSTGELKHGFIALIDKHFPTIALATKDAVYEKTLSNLEEIRARDGKILVVSDSDDKHLKSITPDIIVVPASIEEIQPLLNNVALQLFAYHCSNLRGLDVDKPRNLAKSVTVE
jgi:glucosamine--fructose-6-phosphate aminotransferase (isomerizing)